jgi:hypothetical protein
VRGSRTPCGSWAAFPRSTVPTGSALVCSQAWKGRRPSSSVTRPCCVTTV